MLANILRCPQMCGMVAMKDSNVNSILYFGGHKQFAGLPAQEIAETSATDGTDEPAHQSAESKRQARCQSAKVNSACLVTTRF